jgi:hypothetical protein
MAESTLTYITFTKEFDKIVSEIKTKCGLSVAMSPRLFKEQMAPEIHEFSAI